MHISTAILLSLGGGLCMILEQPFKNSWGWILLLLLNVMLVHIRVTRASMSFSILSLKLGTIQPPFV